MYNVFEVILKLLHFIFLKSNFNKKKDNKEFAMRTDLLTTIEQRCLFLNLSLKNLSKLTHLCPNTIKRFFLEYSVRKSTALSISNVLGVDLIRSGREKGSRNLC